MVVCDAKETLILETYKQRLVLENLEKWKTLECLTNTIPSWHDFGLRAFRDLGELHRISEGGPTCLREGSANRFRVRDKHKISAESGLEQ